MRELENVVRKALLLAQTYTINLDHVRTALNKTSTLAYSPARSFGEHVDELLAAARRGELTDVHARVLETAEREVFTRAIQQAQGNQAKAARWLGISRITMKAKLVQFGLHPSQDHDSASGVRFSFIWEAAPKLGLRLGAFPPRMRFRQQRRFAP